MIISHRLVDDYVMIDFFSFVYDLLQSFCSLCKSFLLASFMNENEVFPFQKREINFFCFGRKRKCMDRSRDGARKFYGRGPAKKKNGSLEFFY
jgi:hypothetical protein